MVSGFVGFIGVFVLNVGHCGSLPARFVGKVSRIFQEFRARVLGQRDRPKLRHAREGPAHWRRRG
jgi:hypothetical protein